MMTFDVSISAALSDASPGPLAMADLFRARPGQLIHGDLLADNGAGADLDPLGEGLRVVSVDGVEADLGQGLELEAGGRLRILADGRFWFDAAGDFDALAAGEAATISVDYSVADALGRISTASLEIDVSDQAAPEAEALPASVVAADTPDAPPVLHPDYVYATEDKLSHINVFAHNGIAADYDPEGGDLRVVDFMGGTVRAKDLGELPGGGLVRILQSGSMWFRADGDYDHLRPGEIETATFTYRATDGVNVTTSHVTVMIQGRNTDPDARDDAFATGAGDGVLHGNLLADNGAGADRDVDSDQIRLVGVEGYATPPGQTFALAEGGVLRVLQDGRFWFDPLDDFDDLLAGETETVSFTYRIEDDGGASALAQAEITVEGAASGPVALDDHFVWSLSGGNAAMNVLADNGSGADFSHDPGFDFSVVGFKPESFSVYRWNEVVNIPGGGTVLIEPDGDLFLTATSEDRNYAAGGELEVGDQVLVEYYLGSRQDDEIFYSDPALVTIDIIA